MTELEIREEVSKYRVDLSGKLPLDFMRGAGYLIALMEHAGITDERVLRIIGELAIDEGELKLFGESEDGRTKESKLAAELNEFTYTYFGTSFTNLATANQVLWHHHPIQSRDNLAIYYDLAAMSLNQ